MPLTIIVKPEFPNVMELAGVPPVPQAIGAAINTASLILSDVVGLGNLFGSPIWGIFDQGGAAVVVPDTIMEVEFRHDSRISTTPQTKGAFMSYNKVEEPFEGRVTFVKGGSIDERNAFLNDIAAAKRSLDLYDLVMPEIVYPSVDVVHYDLRRTAHRGVSLLTVDVWVQEVRETGTSQFSKTETPSGADTTTTGDVQPSTIPSSTTKTPSSTTGSSSKGSTSGLSSPVITPTLA